ncbi:FADR133Wp [Eremothecium gossypii FDAG1]|nr:FADR133Wp [Eremothecium gossypii FDAG1]
MGDCCRCSQQWQVASNGAKSIKEGASGGTGRKHARRYKFQFYKHLQFQGTRYQVVTSRPYLIERYGERKAATIRSFVKCIHRKINDDVTRISDERVTHGVSKWEKSKLFLLLVTLSQRGGPEYWLDKTNGCQSRAGGDGARKSDEVEEGGSRRGQRLVCTLVEQIMRENITEDYDESVHDENYVFSSIWANFMEGLINHYLEKVIIPKSELKVCQQLYKPMMKIISLYNEYNELMDKSERNGFFPAQEEVCESGGVEQLSERAEDDVSTDQKLVKAQKLLWQARQDIPKTISKELTLLSEMYSTLSADEQDYALDEFVCCAEEYIEVEYLPALIDLLFQNCGTLLFWKIMMVLEPFFYYIEEVDDSNERDEDDDESGSSVPTPANSEATHRPAKPDPRMVTLEKICEVAARQKWI